MTTHAMQASHTPTEVEPTAPDANGDRWRQFEPGTVNARCSCGLAMDGPCDEVLPLIQAHTTTRPGAYPASNPASRQA